MMQIQCSLADLSVGTVMRDGGREGGRQAGRKEGRKTIYGGRGAIHGGRVPVGDEGAMNARGEGAIYRGSLSMEFYGIKL